MTSAAESGPRQILRLLQGSRDLYGQYFRFCHPVNAACMDLGHTLSHLNNAVRLFERNYNIGIEPQTAFCQLTVGLPDTLTALRCALGSYALEEGSGFQDASSWPPALEGFEVEDFQALMQPMLTTVGILNEAMESARSECFMIRSSDTIQRMEKHIEENKTASARLRTLLNSFLHGFTMPVGLDNTNGLDSHTFTSANISHREIGQKIAEKLNRKTQKAARTRSVNEELLLWKIRHSIYWLSRGSEHLREWRRANGLALSYHVLPKTEKESTRIVEIFVEVLKAAWLLLDLGDFRAYDQPSFEIREVAACVNKKTLKTLQSFFGDAFMVPNYALIYGRGDFSMGTDYGRKQGRISPPQTVPYTIALSPTGSRSLPLRGEAVKVTSLVELEASSQKSSTASRTHPCSTNNTANLTTSSASSSIRSNVHTTNAVSQSAAIDGLHVSHIEDSSGGEASDDVSAKYPETELYNAETRVPPSEWTGFKRDVFSLDLREPHDTAYTPSRVRIFKLQYQTSDLLRLITYREGRTVDCRLLQPSTAQLVPLYAFTDDQSNASELYITDSGLRSSLQYKFISKDSNGSYDPWELYGFQGALMKSEFEREYRAAGVVLHRRGSSRIESERFPRIQIWTDIGVNRPTTSEDSPSPSSPLSRSSSSPLSSIKSTDFFALTHRHTSNVIDTKIFVFSCNYIYVLFVSDRIILVPHKQRRRLNSSQYQKKTRLCLMPNKKIGASTIQVRTLKGTRSTPAGIPLDPRELKSGDQDRAGGGFEDFHTIEFDLEREGDAVEFTSHFNECVENWRQRCVSAPEYRELRSSRRVTVSSTTTYESGKRPRTVH